VYAGSLKDYIRGAMPQCCSEMTVTGIELSSPVGDKCKACSSKRCTREVLGSNMGGLGARGHDPQRLWLTWTTQAQKRGKTVKTHDNASSMYHAEEWSPCRQTWFQAHDPPVCARRCVPPGTIHQPDQAGVWLATCTVLVDQLADAND
jgi:hypothetical protein